MMQPLIHYDDDDPDGWAMYQDEWLDDFCNNLIKKYGTIAKYGFFGGWDGPQFGGSLLTGAKILKGHITQDFRVRMSWDLSYIEEPEEVREIQRYCTPTMLTVPPKSILLRQWHHDGCNCYIIRPMKKNHRYNGKPFFTEWCRRHTNDVDLEGLI